MARSSTDPTRRDVLRISALVLLGGAAGFACSSDDPDPAAAPDVLDEVPSPTTQRSGPDVDLSLLNTALSLEVLAVDTYQVALDLSLVESRQVVEAVTLHQVHHQEHVTSLVAVVEAAGGEPFTTANPVVRAALVDPGLASVAAERDLITLARDLEQASAQLYVHATMDFSTQELRAIAMSIGAVASRRATILDLIGDLGNERLALYPTDNPLPSDAIVPA